ncbi:MAG: DNA polymerase III subunit gamma/tau C-terminal domain-containing protein [Formosimonas sp.]
MPDWTVLIGKLNLRGLVKQLAQQSQLVVLDETRIELCCESRILASNAAAVSGMEKALAAYFKDAPKTLKIHVGAVDVTPAKVQAQAKEAELQGAQAIIAADATVQAIVREFDGMILPNSIRAL